MVALVYSMKLECGEGSQRHEVCSLFLSIILPQDTLIQFRATEGSNEVPAWEYKYRTCKSQGRRTLPIRTVMNRNGHLQEVLEGLPRSTRISLWKPDREFPYCVWGIRGAGL